MWPSSLQLSPRPEDALLSLHSKNRVRRLGVSWTPFLPGCGVSTNAQEHMASANLSNTPHGKRSYIISRPTFRISQAKECYPHGPPQIPPVDCYSFFPLKTMFSFYLCVMCMCHMCAGACRSQKRHQIPWGHKSLGATYMGAGNQTQVSWKSSQCS